MGNTADSATDPFTSLQLLVFLPWLESNFRKVIGMVNEKKQNPKLKDLFPHALHRVLVVSGVSYLNVCQRDVVSLCMMS